MDELVGTATKMSEFQNTNVPNVNWSQLNQRLRCATTEEKVEEILGTPSGALGTDSIVSLIPNRKKKHVKPTVHLEDKSDGGSSRQSFIFEYLPNPLEYNPTLEHNHTSVENPIYSSQQMI